MIYDPSKIRELRKAKRWTQVELARRASLSQATISDLERGMPSVKAETLISVAVALGVPLKEITKAKAGGEGQDIDDAIALASALDPQTRAAWLAAGRALLGGSSKK